MYLDFSMEEKHFGRETFFSANNLPEMEKGHFHVK